MSAYYEPTVYVQCHDLFSCSCRTRKSIHVWEATIKSLAMGLLYYALRTQYQRLELFGKMLISTNNRVQMVCRVLFSDSGCTESSEGVSNTADFLFKEDPTARY